MRALRPQNEKSLIDAVDGERSAAPESNRAMDAPASSESTESAGDTLDISDKHLILRQTSLLRIIAEFIEQNTLAAGLAALAGELHSRFPSDRVVIGLFQKDKMRIATISQQASIDQKSQEVQQLRLALTEACDQDTQIHYPKGDRKSDHLSDRALNIVEAHRALTAGRAGAEVLTTPMCHQGEFIGAILMERTAQHPWANLTTELMRQIADMVAPLIAIRMAGERSLGQTLTHRVQKDLPALARPRSVLKKLSVVLVTVLVTGAYFVPATHRVIGQAEIVATERRMITAPMAGYIDAVSAEAGDLVQVGTPLLALDTRDLELERAKSSNELASAEAEFRSAMASHDRNKMAIIQARMKQAQAELQLIQTQLDRAVVTSPTDGMVAKGDLNQSLGAPVERGEVLFEITPEQGHEVHLLVDEADIAYIQLGQSGVLALKANPDETIEFTVSTVHPIAQPGEGTNRFRVEAAVLANTADLRPGQTGIGKVAIGEERLLWIWTHRFVEWCEQKVWEWLG